MKPVGVGTAALAVALVGLLVPARAEACAGCSNPNLPAGRTTSVVLAPGELSATFHLTATTTRVVHSERCPDIGPICSQREEPPQQHDQRFYVGELRPVLEVGLTEALGLELQLPLRVTNTDITFRRMDGTAFSPDYENIHHRDETLSGMGDPWLSARGAWSFGRTVLSGKLGTTLPLGRIEDDPFARGRAGLVHQHVQFGTGTFNPLLSVDGVTQLGRFQLLGYAQTQLTLYENGRGYRAGNRYLGGIGVETGLFGKLRAGLGTDLLNEQPERWSGEVQQDGNVGRTDLLVGGMLSYPFGNMRAALSVKVPVWQRFLRAGHTHGGDPGQLTYPAVVNLSLQHTFGRLF